MADSDGVTICIPAYCAASFLPQTLRSVFSQTHREWRLKIGIDPSEQDNGRTVAALKPFLADSRLEVKENRIRLGWAENINELISRVETPFFAILPHDDLWSSSYLETMLVELRADSEAVLAYGDLIRFGHGRSTRKTVMLPGNDRREHLLSFLLRGAEAMPWRGVTRSAMISAVSGFPSDQHKGFAVECEYALALLCAGRVKHVPRVMYFKRIHEPKAFSASKERIDAFSVSERKTAWREHDRRMRELLSRSFTSCLVEEEKQHIYQGALDGAMLARWQSFVSILLDPELVMRAQTSLASLSGYGEAAQAAASIHLALFRHCSSQGDKMEVASHLDKALHLDQFSYQANVEMARRFLSQGRILEGLELAATAQPLDWEGDGQATELIDLIKREL
jgi:hypothetical protein